MTRTPSSNTSKESGARHLLITAGPTQEPIDRVRYIGNRSSGRLGIALADEAAGRGWNVTLLLGPTPLLPISSSVRLLRFRTTSDLEGLLAIEFPHADVLVMAAAVADFRPRPAAPGTEKIKRSDGPVSLQLDPTPDLLAGCNAMRRPDQYIVGFALEPETTLLASARSKLLRKGADMIVGNPLETIDAPTIRATLVRRDRPDAATPQELTKTEFASFLLDAIQEHGSASSTGQ